MAIMPVEKFWMVWGVQRGMPRHQHSSKASAQAEADRLAKLAPGELFVVLSAVDGRICTVSAPQPVPFTKPKPRPVRENVSADGIPF